MASTNSDTFGHKEFCRRTGASSRRIIYLCEKGLIRPVVDPGGRGRHRQFNWYNELEYLFVTRLEEAGLDAVSIKRMAPDGIGPMGVVGEQVVYLHPTKNVRVMVRLL